MYGTAATGSNYFNSYSSLEPDQASMRMNGDGGRTLSGLSTDYKRVI